MNAAKRDELVRDAELTRMGARALDVELVLAEISEPAGEGRGHLVSALDAIRQAEVLLAIARDRLQRVDGGRGQPQLAPLGDVLAMPSASERMVSAPEAA